MVGLRLQIPCNIRSVCFKLCETPPLPRLGLRAVVGLEEGGEGGERLPAVGEVQGARGDFCGHGHQGVEVELEVPLPLGAHGLGPAAEELPAGEAEGLHGDPVPGGVILAP